MNNNEIYITAITTIVNGIFGLIIRAIEKKKLKKANKLVD
jgi:hypothetical protein